jgi:hypothetical protein
MSVHHFASNIQPCFNYLGRNQNVTGVILMLLPVLSKRFFIGEGSQGDDVNQLVGEVAL